jgi:hypothetical protein
MKIYAKLHEAKKEIGTVKKNAKNPHFKNTYADLNALIEAVEPILLEKGLILLQPIKDGKVYTQIIDVESFEVIESFIELTPNLTAQALGSQVTYYRRYQISSLLCLMADDDDGHKASQPQPIAQPKKSLNEDQFSKLMDTLINLDKLEAEKKLIEVRSKDFVLTSSQELEVSELINSKI